MEKRKIKCRKKTINENSNLSIYSFNNFEDYLYFCSSIIQENKNTYSILKKSVLYLYNSKYYLCIKTTNSNINMFKQIHCTAIEFAKHINNPVFFERKLKEYGKIIFNTNAINNCVKYFNK